MPQGWTVVDEAAAAWTPVSGEPSSTPYRDFLISAGLSGDDLKKWGKPQWEERFRAAGLAGLDPRAILSGIVQGAKDAPTLARGLARLSMGDARGVDEITKTATYQSAVAQGQAMARGEPEAWGSAAAQVAVGAGLPKVIGAIPEAARVGLKYGGRAAETAGNVAEAIGQHKAVYAPASVLGYALTGNVEGAAAGAAVPPALIYGGRGLRVVGRAAQRLANGPEPAPLPVATTAAQWPADLRPVPAGAGGDMSVLAKYQPAEVAPEAQLPVDRIAPEVTGELRRIYHELDAGQFSKLLFRQAEKGGGLEPIEGTGGAGAGVYDDINQLAGLKTAPSRQALQRQIGQFLAGGRQITPSVDAALQVAYKRLTGQRGDLSTPELPTSAGQVTTAGEAAAGRSAVQPAESTTETPASISEAQAAQDLGDWFKDQATQEETSAAAPDQASAFAQQLRASLEARQGGTPAEPPPIPTKPILQQGGLERSVTERYGTGPASRSVQAALEAASPADLARWDSARRYGGADRAARALRADPILGKLTLPEAIEVIRRATGLGSRLPDQPRLTMGQKMAQMTPEERTAYAAKSKNNRLSQDYMKQLHPEDVE